VSPNTRRARTEKEERLPTPRKVAQVAQLEQVLGRAEIAISTAYQGVSMAKQVELRSQLRAAGVEMYVVKNTLLRRAASNAGRPEYADLADGATALVVGYDEPVSAAKALTAFLRANDGTRVAIRKAVVSGELVDEAYVRDLATLPSQDELLGKLAGNLIGKVAEFAGLLNAVQRDFVGLIEARAKQLEDQAA
jgi:large subunit ribosomal protein L10